MSVILPQPQQKELPTIILITVWVINNESSSYFAENAENKLHEEPPNLNKL